MRFPAINQIKWRLTLVILVTSGVVLILGAVAVLIYDSINSKRNLVSLVDTIAEITAANSSAALAFRNKRDAQEILDSLRTRSEIDFVCLYLSDGQPFVYFARNGTAFDSAAPVPDRTGHHFENKRLLLRRQINLGDETVGSIVVCANLKQQIGRSNTFLVIALLALGGLIGVAMLLATRLQRLVSDPIAQLAAVAKHITKHNDYGVRARKESPDEIGSLVTAFNQMLSEIDRQNRNLIESESRLKLALSASNMEVWEWNTRDNTVSWSGETNQIFGPAAKTMSLENFANLIHPDDVGQVIPLVKSSVEKLTPFLAEYRVVRPEGQLVWVAHHGQVRRDATGKLVVLAGIVQNISSRKQAQVAHQKLIAQLLHAEEEERRRIARELHDSTAQHLAVLKLEFARLPNHGGINPGSKLLTETRQLLDKAIQEIRTLTYVLHPPLLEEFGLVGPLRDFAAGVTRRSGIQVAVNSDAYAGRLPRNIELTLFRVVQESISNAIRHSGTKDVSIRLARDHQEVRVEIQDFGRGLPTPPAPSDPKFPRNSGVGLAAMQERLTLIGGALNVESDSEGVTVLASVPISPEDCPPAGPPPNE